MSDESHRGKTATAAEPDRAATYREVFGVREYRAVFGASALSWFGDYVAKVAISFLIFRDTGSLTLSAAAFAISFLPWAAGGPVLAALAERSSYRRVMILCDVARMALMGLLAIPGLDLWMLLILLFSAAMFTPPFESSRSAMLPLIMSGDRYVVAISVQGVSSEGAQVMGYLAGGVMAAFNPRLALLVNAGTFALSALLVWRGVRPRPATTTTAHRSHLMRETAQGFRVVFGNRVLRSIALLVFTVVLFPIVIQGLAVGWAHDLDAGARTQGMVMASVPVGAALGSVIVGRLMRPSLRRRMVRPLAILAALALVPALLDPGVAVVCVIGLLAGSATSVIYPLNGLFVQALPNAFRARAFGVMQGGLQIVQGSAVLVTGAIGDAVSVAQVVGIWGILGLVLVGAAAITWPNQQAVNDAVAAAKAANEANGPESRAVEVTDPGPGDTASAMVGTDSTTHAEADYNGQRATTHAAT